MAYVGGAFDANGVTYDGSSGSSGDSGDSGGSGDSSGSGDNTGIATGAAYWSCSGAACDSATLQPWDPTKYIYAAQYAPKDPNNYGGPAYGERMWLTAGFSDALTALLGDNDGCCGTDDNGGGGCGKCMLVTTTDANNSNWSAVVMKKNRCSSSDPNCSGTQLRMNIAVPGFNFPSSYSECDGGATFLDSNEA